MGTIRARLEEGPVPTEIRDRRGRSVEVEVTAGDVAYAVRGLLYNQAGVRRLPRMITEAARSGDLTELAQSHYGRSLALRGGTVLSLGVHLSTYCSEDIPRIRPDEVDRRVEGTLVGRYLVDQYSGACEAWPVEPAPAEWFEPVRSDSPVLLVSGWYDPSTPDVAAEQVRRGLSNSRHIVVRDAGHDAGFGCAAPAMVDFLKSASLEGFHDPCGDRPIRFD